MSNAASSAEAQVEKNVPSIIPLAVGLVGLFAVIVGAFLHASAKWGDTMPTSFFVVGVALIGVARFVQETRITERK
jgi:hypothetical protein